MSLNNKEIQVIVDELASVLPGCFLDKLNSPTDGLLQMVFKKHVLLIDLAAGRTRLHLIDQKLPGPASPPAWLMKARREIKGRLLQSIEQIPGERIVRLVFSKRDQPTRILLAELFGQHGRLLLLDERERILLALIGRAATGEYYHYPIVSNPPAVQSRYSEDRGQQLLANQQAAADYGDFAQKQAGEEKRRQLNQQLAKQAQRLERRLQKMQADHERTLQAEELAHGAEVLKCHLSQITKGQKQATLADPYQPEGQTVVIELDPRKNPIENMKHMFSRAKKLGAARESIANRIASAKSQLTRLQQLKQAIDSAGELSQLEEIQAEISSVYGQKSVARKSQNNKRLPYHEFQSASGRTILVGRSGPDNHQVTFRIARGHDLWLHARGSAGAHVIVRLDRSESVDHETLLDAATLAALYSPQKSDSKVEVSYTQVKNVHPIKGAPPGLVSISKAKTILLRMNSERSERLEKTKNFSR